VNVISLDKSIQQSALCINSPLMIERLRKHGGKDCEAIRSSLGPKFRFAPLAFQRLLEEEDLRVRLAPAHQVLRTLIDKVPSEMTEANYLLKRGSLICPL
jgi:hypothetical protein